MKGRIIFGLMCVAVLAFACGPRPATGDVAGAVRVSHARAASNGPALTSTLAVIDNNHGVALNFRVVTAGTKRLEVNFPSGQTHEVVVVDSLGNEVWRWSKGRMFTQSLQNKVMHQSDTLDYTMRSGKNHASREIHGDRDARERELPRGAARRISASVDSPDAKYASKAQTELIPLSRFTLPGAVSSRRSFIIF